MTRLSTVFRTAGDQVLKHIARIRSLDRLRLMEETRRVDVGSEQGTIQQYIQARFAAYKQDVVIIEAEETKLSQFGSMVTGLLCHGSRFMKFMKNVFTFFIAFGRGYKENRVASCSVLIVKGIMCINFLQVMSSQS